MRTLRPRLRVSALSNPRGDFRDGFEGVGVAGVEQRHRRLGRCSVCLEPPVEALHLFDLVVADTPPRRTFAQADGQLFAVADEGEVMDLAEPGALGCLLI